MITGPDTAVVVCAYTQERWHELLAAIRSVQAQDPAPSEIVVVVDHNDALLQRLRGVLDASRVRLVANSLERGLGGARNTGVLETRARVVAFIDDDAEADSEWLRHLCAAYRDDDVLGVGGRIDACWAGGRPSWFPLEFDWVVGCSYKGLPERVSPVRNLIGCNMSFRRSVFSELGGFRLGYGCDETEFCLRIHERWPTKRLIYTPAAVVSHHVPAARQTFRNFQRRCYFEGGSKAVVTWLHAVRTGLSSERAYVTKTLPLGVFMNLRDVVLRCRFRGVLRAGSIVAGLAFTTAGYAAGKASIESAAARRGYKVDSGGPMRDLCESGHAVIQHPSRPANETGE